ncbi:MAG: GtrA family protein, partial [Nevskiales bacterium]
RFLATGLLNTLVGYGVIAALIFAGAGDVVANAGGYSVGFISSYCINRAWTFQHVAPVTHSLPRFILVCALAYCANLLAALSLIAFGANRYLAHLLGVTVYALLAYAGSVFYVFRQNTAVNDSPK